MYNRGATGTDFWVPRHPGMLNLKSPTIGDPRGESPGMYVSGNFGEMSNFGEFFCVFYDLDIFFALNFIILELVIGHTNK